MPGGIIKRCSLAVSWPYVPQFLPYHLRLRKGSMSEQLDKDNVVSIEELAISNMFVQEALVRLLIDKGILTTQEILDTIAAIKAETPKAQ